MSNKISESLSGELTINITSINPYLKRALFVGKEDNNWFKMRGGIMVRQCGKHKKKRYRKTELGGKV